MSKLSGKPSNAPMTQEQLVAQAELKKAVRTTRNKAADWREENDAELSKIIGISLAGLTNVAYPEERITLTDTEKVKTIVLNYMQICMEHSVIPSMVDVANAIGCTRAAIYDFMKRHPEHPTSEWLRHLSDVFGDVLAKSALSGATQGIPSIFVLKAKFGWREDSDDLPKNEQKHDDMDADAIMERYQDLPDD